MLNLAESNLEELEVDEVFADSVVDVGPIVSLRPVGRGVWYHRARRFVFVVDSRFVAIAVVTAAIVVAVGLALVETGRAVAPSLVAW